jgi:hypothetical protein
MFHLTGWGASCGTEVVRRGMMCGWCVPCGVADDRGHASVYRQLERARGVRAGVVGRGGGDQPGDGGLLKALGAALWGLFPRGCLGALPHACASGGVVASALRSAEGLGNRWSSQGYIVHDWWDWGGLLRRWWDVWLVSRSMSQTTGTTPLFIASQEGKMECVRALLDGGAAINQARVGPSCSKQCPWLD